jgi:WD40 repeat protein
LTDDGSWTIRGPHRGQADELAVFSPKGNRIATGGGAPGIRVWDVERRSVRELESPKEKTLALAFDASSRHLAAGGYEGAVDLWDMDSGQRHVLRHEEARAGVFGMVPIGAQVRVLAFSPDATLLASGGLDTEGVRLWHLPSGQSRLLSGNRLGIWQLCFSPDGRWLASAIFPQVAQDRSIRDEIVNLWEIGTDQRRTLSGHEDSVFAVTFSPDGRSLASGSLDHTVRLWDLETGSSRVLRTHRDNVFRVTFTPDGRHLLSQSNDTTARLWDVSSGREVALLHKWSLDTPAFSRDGRLVVMNDRLWELQTLESRQLLPLDTIGMLALSPDGHTLARNTEKGDLRVWRDDLPEDPMALRAWLNGATDLTVSAGETGTQPEQSNSAIRQ